MCKGCRQDFTSLSLDVDMRWKPLFENVYKIQNYGWATIDKNWQTFLILSIPELFAREVCKFLKN